MNSNVLDSIRELLNNEGIAFREVSHAPTYTSEESAKARGEDVRIGGKAMILKVGKEYRLFVLSASRQIDSASIRRHFGVRKSRFASKDELLELTGLVSGSVPPFGKPILPFDLYVDQSILDNERIAFNAGSLTNSIIMSVEDYLKASKPEVIRFSADSKQG
jgi:Ala-tRNA(Pro) deacylase